jgi:hypothetical protein
MEVLVWLRAESVLDVAPDVLAPSACGSVVCQGWCGYPT